MSKVELIEMNNFGDNVELQTNGQHGGLGEGTGYKGRLNKRTYRFYNN